MAEIFEIFIEISQATYLLFLTISCERVSQNQKADFFFFLTNFIISFVRVVFIIFFFNKNFNS